MRTVTITCWTARLCLTLLFSGLTCPNPVFAQQRQPVRTRPSTTTQPAPGADASVQRQPSRQPDERRGDVGKAQEQNGGQAEEKGNKDWIFGVAAVAGAALLFNHKPADLSKILSDRGPQLRRLPAAAGLAVQSFVMANWPVVIAYQVTGTAFAWVEVSAPGAQEPFYFRLAPTNGQTRQATFSLPASFPKKPSPGLFIIRALQAQAGRDEIKPAPFDVFGMGVGPTAVGSLLLPESHFWRNSSNSGKILGYGFVCKGYFRKANVTAIRLSDDKEVKQDSWDKLEMKDYAKEDWWDGKYKGSWSEGDHQVIVKAWQTAPDDKSAAFCWSRETVSPR